MTPKPRPFKIALPQSLEALLGAYGALLLAPLPAAFLLFDATWMGPASALPGIVAGLSGYITRQLLRCPAKPRNIELFNATTAGLMLGASLTFDWALLPLAAFAGALSILLTECLASRLRSLRGLKILSLSGTLAALAASALAPALDLAPRMAQTAALLEPDFWPLVFLKAAGAMIFTPSPVAGALVLAAVALTSRVFLIAGIASFVIAQAMVVGLTGAECVEVRVAIGANAMLTGIVLSAFCPYGPLGRVIIPLTGVALSAIASIACTELFMALPLFPPHAPFLMAAFLCFGLFHPTNLATFARRRYA